MMNKRFLWSMRSVLFGLAISLLSISLYSAQSPNANLAQTNSGPRIRITQSVDNSKLLRLRGNVHPRARSEFDRGAVPGSQAIHRITMVLQRSPEQQTALAQLMAQQLDKSSPNFHKWLTPAEFGSQFGPADADVQAIKDWLTTQGFTGIAVSAGKTFIEFDGNAGLVQSAFHTPVHSYFVNGKSHFANEVDPEIPAALSQVISGIVALHNFRRKPLLHSLGTVQRNAKTGAIRPLFTFSDVNGPFFAMGPADFAKIYNIPSGASGSGQSIAIVGRTNINIQDVRDFRSIFGLPANDPQIIVNGPDPGIQSGDELESDLDVQWSGAVAPAATIKFVPTLTDDTDALDGVDASALFIVDNNIAPILSDSYGSCEANLGAGGNSFYNALWEQAAAEGITVSVASGDNGSAGCDDPNSVNDASQGLAVSGMASTPFNVAVGGTDFDQANNQSAFWNTTNTTTTPPIPASAKGYIPEIPWNDSCAAAGATGCNSVTSTSPSLNIVAGSGGASTLYPKPSYQTGVTGMPADGHRDIPDVSLFASDGQNNSFYIVCQSDADISGDTGCNLTKFSTTAPFHDFQAVGGTSAGAPAFAGIMALVNQAKGTPSGQGNANLVLYALGKSETFSGCNSASIPLTGPPDTCTFNDVAKGNVSVPCAGGSPSCSKTSSGGFGVLATSPGGSTVAYGAGTGYDLATGLGTVNVKGLLANWISPTLIGTTATLTISPSSFAVGSETTASGSVTRNSGTGTPSGMVVLEDASTHAAFDHFILDASGNFDFVVSLLPAGNYSVIAHYGGDGTFGPSDSAPFALNIPKTNSKVIVSFVSFGTSTFSLSTAAQSVQYGSPYILRIDVANASGTPCQNPAGASTGVFPSLPNFVCPVGTVALSDNGTALKDFPNAQAPNASSVAKLNDRGYVEDQPIQLNVGTHSITAAYTADASSSYNSQASSNALSVTITKANTATAVTSNVTSVVSGGSVTLTATVSSNSNSAQGPTGTVQFTNGSSDLGTAANCAPAGATSSAGASCTATLTTAISALPPGLFGTPEPQGPSLYLLWLASACALICLLMALRLPKRASVFAYSGVAAFLLVAALISGCSGAGGSSGGGGGGTGQQRSIGASYSGDSNYASSTGGTTVSVH